MFRITNFITILLLFPSLYLSSQNEHFADLLQNVDARDKVSLNGLWDVIVDPLENGFYNHRLQPKGDGFFLNAQMEHPSHLIEYDFSTSEQLMVPGDWNTQKEKLYYYEGTVWYKKDFNFQPREDEKLYLYFGAVNYEALVYVNGEFVGSHIGGYTPFQFDITDKVKAGNNFVVLKVDNKRKAENVPTVNMDWWNYGGITRSVYIVKTPKTHIKDYSIQLASETNTEIVGWISVENAKEKEEVNISIPELKIDEKLVIKNGIATFKLKTKPQLWEPENPKIYSISLAVHQDIIKDEIGFKTVETDGSKILLNGKPVFLKGICMHEEAPFKTGRITSAEECKILLEWAKDLGCNFVRLAHYPHSEAMVRQAEKMGFMIWSEIPVYWTVHFENPDTYANAENQLTEMISRDKNRAGILLWSVANETPESEARLDFLTNLATKARQLDKSRLITAALDTQGYGEEGNRIEDPLGEVVDVIGINNYCGWYVGAVETCAELKWASEFNKPMIMSEVGGGALYGLHGNKEDIWTEEYQAEVYKANIEMMRNIDFLAGLSPWILMDFRSARRPLKRIQEDFNRKGLISEQGMKKQAFFVLKEFYEKENNKQ